MAQLGQLEPIFPDQNNLLEDLFNHRSEYLHKLLRNDWGTLATFTAADHAEYLKLIPQANKDAVKDYFKNKSKK